MVDIPTEVANESIKRQVEQIVGRITIEELPNCPIRYIASPEQIKRLAAFGVVMAKIAESSSWN